MGLDAPQLPFEPRNFYALLNGRIWQRARRGLRLDALDKKPPTRSTADRSRPSSLGTAP